MQEAQRQALSARFERFSLESEKMGSPLYGRLSSHIAGNDELLAVAQHTFKEPVPNAFLGAVHYLLLNGTQHELRDHYRSTSTRATDDAALCNAFTNFCLRYRDEVVAIVSRRLVQTNEIGRSAILAPAFGVVYREVSNEPLALIEIGASAGLNLLWDKYLVHYSDGTAIGPHDSPVILECKMKGASFSGPLKTIPSGLVSQRIGIDLNPIDLRDREEQIWLRALVWPDQPKRARLLEAAMALALEVGVPDMRQGNALIEIPHVLESIPDESNVCVYNSSVLYQFTHSERIQLVRLLSAASKQRSIWHVSAESEEGLWVYSYQQGTLKDRHQLAEFDAHGRWLEWFN